MTKVVNLVLYERNLYRRYLVRWLSDAALMHGWGGQPIPEAKIDDWASDPNAVLLLVQDTETAIIVGVIVFYDWNREQGIIQRGTLIDPHYQTMGYGTAAMTQSQVFAIQELGVKRIEVYVEGYNTVGRHLVEKLGYTLDRYESSRDRYHYFAEA